MQIFKGLVALWRIASWLRSEKKKMESDVDKYLTQERALEWRLQLEKIFKALATGGTIVPYTGVNFRKLPSPIRWLFGATTLDNRIGEFGMWLLKSKKIEEDDKALNQPLYRMH